MIFQRANRTDPERVFIIVRNNEGSTLNADDAACWELAAASVDGVRVRQPDTGLLQTYAGVVDAAIANGEYGLIQIYGYRSTSRVFQTGTSQDTGLLLGFSAGAAYLQSVQSTLGTGNAVGLAFLAESITDQATSSTVSRKIFIRALG
jgi:hypothetical protein